MTDTNDFYDLERFIQAQAKDFAIALAEINNGEKNHTGCGTFFRNWRV